jgi:hypothetical protein
MSHPFEYQAPSEDHVEQMAFVSRVCLAVYDVMMCIDPSAERTLAIRKLQEARMWANAAILGVTIQ